MMPSAASINGNGPRSASQPRPPAASCEPVSSPLSPECSSDVARTPPQLTHRAFAAHSKQKPNGTPFDTEGAGRCAPTDTAPLPGDLLPTTDSSGSSSNGVLGLLSARSLTNPREAPRKKRQPAAAAAAAPTGSSSVRLTAAMAMTMYGCEYYDSGDEGDAGGNGCGEGVSRNTSEDDESGLRTPSAVCATTTAAAAAAAVSSLSPATAKATAAGPASCRPGGHPTIGPFPTFSHAMAAELNAGAAATCGAALVPPLSSSPSLFSAPAVKGTAQSAGATKAAAAAAPAVSALTSAVMEAIRARQLRPPGQQQQYQQQQDDEEDGSTVVSGLQLMMLRHEGLTATAAAAAAAPDAKAKAAATFLDKFAPLYEIAIFEVITECDRRVARASAEDRAAQLAQLRGRNNGGLAVSAHCFDSPVSLQPSSFPSLTLPQPQSFAGGGGTSPCALPAASPSSSLPPPAPAGHCHPRTVSQPFSCSYASSPTGTRAQIATSTLSGLSTIGGGGGLVSATECVGSAAAWAAAPPQPQPSPYADARPSALELLPPAESVARLLRALDRQLRCQESAPLVFMAALAYLSRFTARCVSSHGSVTPANRFRMTVASLLTASKMYNEYGSHRLNKRFAEASGIPLAEVSRLELDFLYLIDFELLLEEADVEGWVRWMEALAVRHNMATPLQTFMVDPTRASSSSSVSVPGHHQRPANDAAATSENYAQYHHHYSSAVHPHHQQQQSQRGSLLSAAANADDDGAAATSLLPNGSFASFPAASHFSHLPGLGRALSSAMIDATHARGGSELPLLSPAAASAVTGSFAGGHSGRVRELDSGRLFTVVHAAPEPRTPPTIRELCRLGATPPSPLPPPLAATPGSPVSFFKKTSATGGGSSSLMGGSATSRSQGMQPNSGAYMNTNSSNNNASSGGANLPYHNQQRGTLASNSSSTARTATAAAVPPAVAALASPGDALRPTAAADGNDHDGETAAKCSGTFMRRVREALTVTASLVRGQLDVMHDGDTKSGGGGGRSDRAAAHGQGKTSIVAPATADQASFYPIRQPAAVITTAPWADPQDGDGYDGAGEGEEEEGYWDDYGYYHYHDDEEGYYDQDGNYYLYADDEAAVAAGGYTGGDDGNGDFQHPQQRNGGYWDADALRAEYDDDGGDEFDDDKDEPMFRAPPRTHSPPAL